MSEEKPKEATEAPPTEAPATEAPAAEEAAPAEAPVSIKFKSQVPL